MLRSIDESHRLAILRRYAILDTPPEEVFDRIARMAARYFRTPIGTVTFIDQARQWFKAVHGLDVRETGRDIAFCNHTIMSDDPLIVPDARNDPRFADNPLVTGTMSIGFYAGAPLVSAAGFRVGAVSVIDTVPRHEFGPEDCQHLADLAAIVMHELEMRQAASDFEEEIERHFLSEERLKLAVAHAPVTLATLDRDLRYTWIVNPPAPLTPQDYIGRCDSDLWGAEAAEAHMAQKREVMATGESRRWELTVEIVGQLRYFDVSVEPLYEHGKVVGAAYAAVEITERKMAELALARSEARHRAVLDTAADAMVVINERGLIEHFNPAAEHIFGYTAEEVAGQNVSLLMEEGDRVRHDQYIRRYLETGQAHIIGIGREVAGLRKNGQRVPLELTIAEWWDGRRRYFTGMMRDITRRKEADAALRTAEAEREQSLALLNAAVEGVPDPFFHKDREGRYQIANQATVRALGVAGDIIGKTDFDLMPAADAQRMRRTDREVMRHGEPTVYEEQVTERDTGMMRWYLTSKIPLHNRAGEVIGVVGVARDITERRAMVDQLRQAKEQAESANRAKTSFLAAASHDLRQPVQALLLFTGVLQGRLKGHPAGPVVGRMKQSLDALQMLLESLLDISRLDAGVISANPQPCNLSALCGRLVGEYRESARRKGLKLVSAGCGYWTVTDAQLMERVLRNLIENAIRYTESGRILVGCRRRGDRLRLQVIDTGIGIPADQSEAIFQEFHQLGNPERDRAKGLGLGLSIVRRLLDLLGHELTVSSVVGLGTCFSIDLPRIKEAAAVPAAKSEPCREIVGPAESTVMVIDDEPIVRSGLEILLRDWGYGVVAAADVAEALGQVESRGAPDAIIADYRLQGGHTGTEAVQAIQHACGRALPAIIVTGDTAPERIAEVERSGLTIAHKPISGEGLRQLVSAALAGGKA
jgi:PAS domain S-box-containing protein